MKVPRVDFLPSPELHEEPEIWYLQWPLAPIRLLGESRRIWVNLSWFSNLPYWLRFWVLFGGGACCPPPKLCHLPVGKILVGVGWDSDEISGAYPLMVSTLSGAQLEDTEKFPPSQKIPGGRLGEKAQQNTQPVERYWSGASTERNRGIPGAQLKRYWGHSIVGDWMILAECIGKRLIWHFLNSAVFIEFVGIKVRKVHESFAPKRRDRTPPGQLWFSQVTEKFTGVAEA